LPNRQQSEEIAQSQLRPFCHSLQQYWQGLKLTHDGVDRSDQKLLPSEIFSNLIDSQGQLMTFLPDF